MRNNLKSKNESNSQSKKHKKNKTLKLIFFIILIIVIIFAIKYIASKKQNKNNSSGNNQDEKYVKVQDDGTKLNDSKELNKNKKLDNLELSNIQLTYKDGITTLFCDVKNTSDTATSLQSVKVILRDKQGNDIYSFDGIIEAIQPGETQQFNTSITADFANAYDFTIVKK